MIVEIQDRERVLVHSDVAETVDAMLLGEPVAPELRWRDEEGVHRSQSRPKPSAREAARGRPVQRAHRGGRAARGAASPAGAARARTAPAAMPARTALPPAAGVSARRFGRLALARGAAPTGPSVGHPPGRATDRPRRR